MMFHQGNIDPYFPAPFPFHKGLILEGREGGGACKNAKSTLISLPEFANMSLNPTKKWGEESGNTHCQL